MLVLVSCVAVAQLDPPANCALIPERPPCALAPDAGIASILRTPIALPHMPPSSAFEVYQRLMRHQELSLQQYSAVMLVKVALPETLQGGEFELIRHYAAPRTLEFKALRFTGDGFVKHNVIARMLESEADHVRHARGALTAINSRNYVISYKGEETIEGRTVYAYKLKPRKKRDGLFKGRLFLDSMTGRLVRTEGTLVKSPSFFIRKVDFLQDYIEVGGLTFLGHMHCQVLTRVVGRVVLDTYQHDYQPTLATGTTAIAQAPVNPTLPTVEEF